MNFDRNTIVGFIVLAILFIGFFWYTRQEQMKLQEQRAEQARIDSIAKAKQIVANPPTTKTDTTHTVAPIDSNNRFQQATQGTEQLTSVENDLIKVTFTNKGGQVKSVELKKFKGPDSTDAKLGADPFDKISYPVIAENNKTAEISDLYFSGGQIQKSGDNQVISYQL